MHPFFRPYSVRIPSGLIHHMEYSARCFPSPSCTRDSVFSSYLLKCINSEIIHQNGCLIWLKKPTGWRGRIRTCPPGMALIINHFFILHRHEGRCKGRIWGKGTLQKWMTPRSWTDFVPKMFHLFTQPPIINRFFLLHRQEGRKE